MSTPIFRFRFRENPLGKRTESLHLFREDSAGIPPEIIVGFPSAEPPAIGGNGSRKTVGEEAAKV